MILLRDPHHEILIRDDVKLRPFVEEVKPRRATLYSNCCCTLNANKVDPNVDPFFSSTVHGLLQLLLLQWLKP